MARQVLAWQCKYCGAIKRTENVALKHEKACLKNPNPKNCIVCQHSYFNEEENYLMCRLRKIKCTKSVSANCDQFKPRL